MVEGTRNEARGCTEARNRPCPTTILRMVPLPEDEEEWVGSARHPRRWQLRHQPICRNRLDFARQRAILRLRPKLRQTQRTLAEGEEDPMAR
jgi:hypothetical protein